MCESSLVRLPHILACSIRSFTRGPKPHAALHLLTFQDPFLKAECAASPAACTYISCKNVMQNKEETHHVFMFTQNRLHPVHGKTAYRSGQRRASHNRPHGATISDLGHCVLGRCACSRLAPFQGPPASSQAKSVPYPSIGRSDSPAESTEHG